MDVDKNPTTGSKQKPKKTIFKCTYCVKEFTSYQALGGHQYAHRNERRRQQDSVMTSASAAKAKAANKSSSSSPLLWVSGGSLIQKLPPQNPYRHHRLCSYIIRSSPSMIFNGGAVVDNRLSCGLDTTLSLGLSSNSSGSANNVGDEAALGIDLELRL